MTETTDIINTNSDAVGHQLAKLVLGTVAGFIAGKLTNAAYDKVLEIKAHRAIAAIEQ